MNNNEDKNKKREEKIKKMLAELRENANGLTEDELSSLEGLIESLTDVSDVSLKKRFLTTLVEFIKTFVIAYVTSLLSIGFFIGNMVLNHYYAFLIPVPVAFILALIEILPLPTLFKSHIFDYCVVFALFILMCYIMNMYWFTVFDSSSIWIWYLFLSEIGSILVNLCIIKINFGGRIKL